MSTIAEVQVSARDTALGSSFEEIPSLVCEIEQVVAADGLRIWLSGAELSSLNAALEKDPTVVVHSVVSGDSERWLYNIDFSEEVTELFSLVVDEGGTMLTATAMNRRWTLRLRVPRREAVRRVHERLAERGIRLEIIRLQSFSTDTADDVGLTSEQFEAIAAAIDYGYFKIPREMSLEELAAELGISHQALSERLRRAYRTLATTELELEEELEEIH